jgi:hypothetical protein
LRRALPFNISHIDKRLLLVFVAGLGVRIVYLVASPSSFDWIAFTQFGQATAHAPTVLRGVYSGPAYFFAPFYMLWSGIDPVHSNVEEIIYYSSRTVYFQGSPEGYFFVFMLKLPAILFDALAALFIVKIVARSHSIERARWTTAAWFLNPMTMVAIGFNSFDIVPAALILVALYLFARSKFVASSALITIAMLLRLFPVIFLALLLTRVGRGRDWGALAKMIIVPVSAILAVGLVFTSVDREGFLRALGVGVGTGVVIPETVDFLGSTLPLLTGIIPSDTIGLVIVLFPIVAALVTSPQNSLSKVAWQSYALLLVYLGFAWSAPTFLVWALPFLIAYVAVGENHRLHTILLSVTAFLWAVVRSPHYIFVFGNALFYIPATGEVLSSLARGALWFSADVLNLVSVQIRGSFTAILAFLLLALLVSGDRLSRVATTAATTP